MKIWKNQIGETITTDGVALYVENRKSMLKLAYFAQTNPPCSQSIEAGAEALLLDKTTLNDLIKTAKEAKSCLNI